ncbi:hypothetical protein [Streptomyces huiliensis]|uniref:hypothetical protein n=1 Tax=Streptomyces huiliensis TaxID=2876027 RepID=UPI001CBEFE9F|nr:hypothetical protein [Streptomyces huiliensis]MBZ4321467.1 hypothetical protein [Streptomyces huiliensis]
MTTEAPTSDPATAYVNAPSIIAEIGWVARQRASEPDREFWLRKAAVFDRIAIKEAANYAPEVAASAIEAAGAAALQLVRYDAMHEGLSPRGLELVTADDHREYVRHAYLAWSRS